MSDTLGIYVHIPYCLKKCLYCDFISFPLEEAKVSPDEYVCRVCDEIENASKDLKDRCIVDSIFFGGGTPTCIGTDMIGRILLSIRKNFNVAENAEVTIEANPETINDKRAGIYKSLGFNRVSMGVQSLDDRILKSLGRVHDSKKALEAYEILRKAGFENINIDLMFGIPGQSFDDFKDSFDKVLSLDPEHISFYSLQIEEGTPFYEEYKEGNLILPSWEEDRKMYSYALDRLKEYGYLHYEISNACKPGFECRHNLKYWTMKPYLGFGTSAHSYMDGKRFFNSDDLNYVRCFEEESDDILKERITDFIFTELRLIDGIDLEAFEDMFGMSFESEFSGLLNSGDINEYLDMEKDEEGKLIKLALNRKGLDNTNPVMQKFIEAVYEGE